MLTRPPGTRGVDFITTGGSSGEPLRFYIGSNRSAVEYAYLTSGWKRIGYRLGTPLAVIRGRMIEPDRNKFLHEYDPLLRHHHYSNFHMTDENMRRYLEHIATLGPCFLHVYPSATTALCKFIRRTGITRPTNVRGIIAESEIVYPSERRLAEETFGCRYWSGYGHTEKLVAAAECEHSHDYHVWPTYGYFELLDHAGNNVMRPGGYGEITGTGFINRVMPFIRYRTGDWATYVADRCDACGRAHPIIRDIEGHKTQGALVAIDGSSISIAALNMHDDTYDNVRRYQFRQDRPGHATLRIIPALGFRNSDRERITSAMQRRLSGRVTFDIEACEHIPLTARGKAVYVDQRIPSAGLEQESLPPRS
jgi:phenylacetate-CoA ligase